MEGEDQEKGCIFFSQSELLLQNTVLLLQMAEIMHGDMENDPLDVLMSIIVVLQIKLSKGMLFRFAYFNNA